MIHPQLRAIFLVQQLVVVLTAFLPFRVRNSRKKRELERKKCAKQLLNVVAKVQKFSANGHRNEGSHRVLNHG